MKSSSQNIFCVFAIVTYSIVCQCCTESQDSVPDLPFGTDTITNKIDTFWGSPPDEMERLSAFDFMWDIMAEGYAGFAVSDVDWDEIRSRYRRAIFKADSYGRFYQVFSQIFTELHDGHTAITSTIVCGSTDYPLNPPRDPRLSERPPLFILENRISYIGVCATVLKDDTLLVYNVAEDNPAGLEPGDVIVGYDRRSWRKLLGIIDKMELPSCGRSATWAEAIDIQRMESVVNNGHLFKEMDVRKANTGERITISTEKLIGHNSDFLCNSQLPLMELDFPCTHWGECYDEYPVLEGAIKWTILPNQIGYIYVYGWTGGSTTSAFARAIDQMMDTTRGIVIDQRFGIGGRALWNEGIKFLFDKTHKNIFHEWIRAEFTGSNYKEMEYSGPFQDFYIISDTETFYDNPIAVLTGPLMGSAGDIFPLLMAYHPRARRFGRPTDGRFGSLVSIKGFPNRNRTELISTMTESLVSDAKGNFLQETPLDPEERVWLEPDDVVAGIDTVRQAAFDWIISSQ